jgi:hypothetical protein
LGESVEELEDFELGDSKKKIRVGSQLSPEMKEALVAFLRQNEDVFYGATMICQGYLLP